MTFRNWVGVAQRARKAIVRRVRAATGRVEVGVGVGDDESRFGGHRAQIWFEFFEEAQKRVRVWLEKSTFERFPRVERLLRRLLAKSEVKIAPPLSPPKRPTGPLGVRSPPSSPELEAYKAQIRQGIVEGHMRRNANLRDCAPSSAPSQPAVKANRPVDEDSESSK